jgi:hypothetical protein
VRERERKMEKVRKKGVRERRKDRESEKKSLREKDGAQCIILIQGRFSIKTSSSRAQCYKTVLNP